MRTVTQEDMERASRIARQLRRGEPLDRDGLESAAQAGLSRAAQTFDPSKGVPWGGWRQQCVRGEVLDEMRRLRGGRSAENRRHQRNTTSLDASISERGGSWHERVEALHGEPGGEPELSDPEVLSVLSKRERLLITSNLIEGKTLQQVGQILGVTESRVCQIKRRALTKMRNELTGEVVWHPPEPEAAAPPPPVPPGMGVLSDRLRQIILLSARGMNADQIGKDLHIATETVKAHKRRVSQILGTRGMTQALWVAMKRGEISPPRLDLDL